jgi:formamidopyrimidine-DNA glycosylase
MPELPDLQLFSNHLHRRLQQRTVSQVTVHKSKRLNVTVEVLAEQLIHAKFAMVKRKGKCIHFHFVNKPILEVHLMLKGGFDLIADDSQVPYKILTLGLDEQEYLVVSDPQSLVTLTFDPLPISVPDALDITLDYLTSQLQSKKTRNIKAFLLDQHILRGIGNAYADEILWYSRISPESLCGRLPPDAVNACFQAIKTVLTEAVQHLETVQPDRLKGEYRDFLKIHNPQKNLSPTGKPIHQKKIANKITFYSDDQYYYK